MKRLRLIHLLLWGPVFIAVGLSSVFPSGNPPAPVEHQMGNLIKNGNFQNALDDWITIGAGVNPYHPEDPGRAVFRTGERALAIDIRNPGQSQWSVMFFQSVRLEKSTTYAVSFKARAEARIRLVANMVQDRTWTNYSGDKEYYLTNTLSGYSYEFTMPETGSALVQFCLGNAGTGRIWFENIVMTKKGATQSAN